MKGKIIAAILLAGLFMLVGCSKDPDGGIPGSYTYKISGTVTLTAGIDMGPVTLGLCPEQGQLHILEDGDGKVVITFNDLLGNADVTSGVVEDGMLILAGTDVKAARLTDGDEKIGSGLVAYGGSGKLYDGMLIINLQYQGQFTVNGIPMKVLSSDVKCVAQAN